MVAVSGKRWGWRKVEVSVWVASSDVWARRQRSAGGLAAVAYLRLHLRHFVATEASAAAVAAAVAAAAALPRRPLPVVAAVAGRRPLPVPAAAVAVPAAHTAHTHMAAATAPLAAAASTIHRRRRRRRRCGGSDRSRAASTIAPVDGRRAGSGEVCGASNGTTDEWYMERRRSAAVAHRLVRPSLADDLDFARLQADERIGCRHAREEVSETWWPW